MPRIRGQRCPESTRLRHWPSSSAVALDTAVRTEDVQTTVIALQQKKLIHWLGHGAYSIADSFVKQVWLERQSIRCIGAPGDATLLAPSA